MTIVKPSRLFVLFPSLILYVLILNIAWDLIKINVDPAIAKQWPWRFNLLDISTCSALAGILAGLLLTRAQFAKTARPAIGWMGDEKQESLHIKNSAWTVTLHNMVPGWCQVKKIMYSYALTGNSLLAGKHGTW